MAGIRRYNRSRPGLRSAPFFSFPLSIGLLEGMLVKSCGPNHISAARGPHFPAKSSGVGAFWNPVMEWVTGLFSNDRK